MATALCPKCGTEGRLLVYPGARKLKCPNGCGINGIVDLLALAAQPAPPPLPPPPQPLIYANGHAEPVPYTPPPTSLKVFQARLLKAADKYLKSDPEYQKPVPAETLLEPLIKDILDAVEIMTSDGMPPPPDLTRQDIEDEVDHIARLAIEDWANVRIWSREVTPVKVEEPQLPEKRRSSVIVENYELAEKANAEYLARPPIIERLGYSQSIMLMIGGKHHGKTTNIRTLVMSTMRGLPIWGRETAQGPVVYAASDDEVAASRNELLQMGWRKGRDPLQFLHIDPDSDATPEQILEDISEVALTSRAVMIVLDMLFDFTGIKDEMSYAQTRSAIGMVQRMANVTKCLVVGSHHTPKYMTDAHNAANAALGSQGISARFSPIVLTRKYTDNLFTVESTTTRDPRGQAIIPSRIIKNEQGWIETTDEFKEWMKWEIYAGRVMGLFEGGDPKQGYTVYEVAEKLEIDRARAQNALYQLTQTKPIAKLKREKHGRSWRYYLGVTDMFEREGGTFAAPDDDDDKTS